jgi:hypothetical protein
VRRGLAWLENYRKCQQMVAEKENLYGFRKKKHSLSVANKYGLRLSLIHALHWLLLLPATFSSCHCTSSLNFKQHQGLGPFSEHYLFLHGRFMVRS